MHETSLSLDLERLHQLHNLSNSFLLGLTFNLRAWWKGLEQFNQLLQTSNRTRPVTTLNINHNLESNGRYLSHFLGANGGVLGTENATRKRQRGRTFAGHANGVHGFHLSRARSQALAINDVTGACRLGFRAQIRLTLQTVQNDLLIGISGTHAIRPKSIESGFTSRVARVTGQGHACLALQRVRPMKKREKGMKMRQR